MNLGVQTSNDETKAVTDVPTPSEIQSEELSTRVVLAVAERAGRDPVELSSLNDVVNTVALNALFDTGDDEQRGTEPTISIPYEGYDVTISGEEIRIEELDRSEDPLERAHD